MAVCGGRFFRAQEASVAGWYFDQPRLEDRIESALGARNVRSIKPYDILGSQR